MKRIFTGVLAISALAGLTSLPLSADDTETLHLHKEAQYDYATQTGEITLESYVPGEMKVVQEAKAIDAVIVMDFSGSMTGNEGKYTSSKTFTKTVIDMIYDANNTYYYNGSKYVTLASISDNAGINADKTVDTQIYSNNSGTPLKVNYKGTNYDLYAYFVHAKDNSNYPCCWLYIKVGGKRVFVRHDGSFIEENGSTNIKYWTFPTGTDGYFITPARGKDRPLYITMKEETGVKISYRIDALQAAVGKFLDMIAEHAQKTGKTDRVSTVLFQAQGKKYYPGVFNENNVDNPTDYITAGKKTYLMECPTDKKRSGPDITEDSNIERRVLVGKRFVDMSTQDALKLLKFSISNTTAYGNTPINIGVDLAKRLMEKSGRTGSDVARYIIVFTDGEPTTLDGSGNAYTDVATPAVKNLYDIKNSSTLPTTIYTIYCNSSSPKTNVSTFLDHLSSNYPKSKAYNDGTTRLSGDDAKYYKTATDNLEEIFEAIGSEILVEVDEKYDVNTTMRDFINNNYFKLPENTTKSEIHVYENPLQAYNQSETDPAKKYVFSNTMTELTESDGIHIVVKNGNPEGTTDAEKNDQVIVYGFNYSEKWCGYDTQNKKVHGSRLIVKLPFVFVTQMEVNSTVPTNGDDSGVYPVEKNEDGTPKTETDPVTGEEIPVPSADSTHYNMPHITFCTLTITRNNLDEGETAIYKVTDETGKFIANIPLGGVKGNLPVSKSLYGLPGELGHSFTVTESGWNWAYDKSGKISETKEVSVDRSSGKDRYYIDFEFSGQHKTATSIYKPEETHNHDEDFVTNKMRPL